MRLFDAIIDANHRALSGDQRAGLHVVDYAGELPVVAMTCIDPRLNRLFPGAMGLPADGFIWLRNAGNIIYGPLSSMTRSLALACAVKGGREIVIIGHTDCQVCKTSIPALIEKFKAIGVERKNLPENLTEYFRVFSDERQNVIQSVEYVRSSPIISPTVPVQGLMVDINTGKLEWAVNGYEALERRAAAPLPETKLPEITGVIGNLAERIGGTLGDLKFPDTKIGEIASQIKSAVPPASDPLPSAPPPSPPPPRLAPRGIPVPPPIPNRQGMRSRRG